MLDVWQGSEYASEQTLDQANLKISNEFLSVKNFTNYLHNANTFELHGANKSY